jgi:hypothetical protein
MIAYERRDDAALVLAAGVPEAWVREAPGVRVRGLPTYFGPLDYTLHAASAERIDVTLGSALRWPPGGVIIVSPFARPLRRVLIDGREQPAQAPDRVALSTPARHVVLDY